jgi:hypothetical protein
MSGHSLPGYYTFHLDEMIPLNVGDVFEIVFKITVDGDAGVPISEIVSLNNKFYYENISFISYDGENWTDLFNLTGEYPNHTYNSQVACIKAFTVLNPIGTTLELDIENRTDSTATLVANVLNQWGHPLSGNVTFTLANQTYVVRLTDGIAKKEIVLINASICAEFNAIGYNSSRAEIEMRDPLLATEIFLNVSGQYNPLNITAVVVDSNGDYAKSGHVTFIIDGEEYLISISNGTARLEDINVLPLKLNVSAFYRDSFYYSSCNTTRQIEMQRLSTEIRLNVTSGSDSNNPVKVRISVFDSNGNPVKSGNVTLNMSGKAYSLEVVNGTVEVDHTFLSTGNKTINATFCDVYLYDSSNATMSLNVSKMKVNLTVTCVVYETTASFAVEFANPVKGFNVTFHANGKDYNATSRYGLVIYEIKDLDFGTYEYSVRLISDIYEADDYTGEFNVTIHKTKIIASEYIYPSGNYSVELKNMSGGAVPNRTVSLTVNGTTYNETTDNTGTAVFHFTLGYGDYSAKISFAGDDDYSKSQLTVTIKSKSTIEFVSDTYSSNSQYSAVLRDSSGKAVANEMVEVIFNGVNYGLYSDANGKVSFTINTNPGTYTVRIINPVSGEARTQTINVVKRITQNRALTMYYGAGKYYKVKVVDDYGKAVKGLKVTFKLSGKYYYAYTDNNGYASLKITKKPGKYTITAEYKGFRVSNKITVKSTIVTKNIKVKKGKAIKFKAKLLSKNGKILKNKKVKFKFKGKTYKVKTNKKGIATLKINKKYKVGKYSITTSYGKLKVKNIIRIKK